MSPRCSSPGGRFRVSADTPEMMELFQRVARRVGDMLRQPVVSYANGREIVITFGQEEAHGPGFMRRPAGLSRKRCGSSAGAAGRW